MDGDEEDEEVDVGEVGESGASCMRRAVVTHEARESDHRASDFWCGGRDTETKIPDGILICTFEIYVSNLTRTL